MVGTAEGGQFRVLGKGRGYLPHSCGSIGVDFDVYHVCSLVCTINAFVSVIPGTLSSLSNAIVDNRVLYYLLQSPIPKLYMSTPYQISTTCSEKQEKIVFRTKHGYEVGTYGFSGRSASILL